GGYFLTLVASHGAQRALGKCYVPGAGRVVGGLGLGAERLAVQEQLYFVAVAVHLHFSVVVALALVGHRPPVAGAVEEALAVGDFGPVGLAQVVEARPQKLAGHVGLVAQGQPGAQHVGIFGADNLAGGLGFVGGHQLVFAVVLAHDV
nr:hypothetical protein [Tanacetum cinerariifolium]